MFYLSFKDLDILVDLIYTLFYKLFTWGLVNAANNACYKGISTSSILFYYLSYYLFYFIYYNGYSLKFYY